MTIINLSGSGTKADLPDPVYQSKAVTATEFPTVVVADSGYDALSKATVYSPTGLEASNIRSGVTIAGITGTYGGEAPELQQKTASTTSLPQTITADSGYDGLLSVTIPKPSELKPENIVAGVTIFGVTGTASTEKPYLRCKAGTIKVSLMGTSLATNNFWRIKLTSKSAETIDGLYVDPNYTEETTRVDNPSRYPNIDVGASRLLALLDYSPTATWRGTVAIGVRPDKLTITKQNGTVLTYNSGELGLGGRHPWIMTFADNGVTLSGDSYYPNTYLFVEDDTYDMEVGDIWEMEVTPYVASVTQA